jgi:putative ATP-dependent endonuclease of OLD family
VLEPTPLETPAWAFREYLREFFIFIRVADHIPALRLSAPVFFFSSDRTLTKNFEVQAGQLTEQSHFDGIRSAYQAATGESMNLMQWGAQHFVRLHRRAVNAGAEVVDKTWRTFYLEDPDVKLLNHYMHQLGYSWTFATDNDQLRYELILEKDGERRSSGMFSSGEREIVHFLLAMFALNVRDGLILVDEPGRRQLLLPSCCLTRIGYRVASVRMLPH